MCNDRWFSRLAQMRTGVHIYFIAQVIEMPESKGHKEAAKQALNFDDADLEAALAEYQHHPLDVLWDHLEGHYFEDEQARWERYQEAQRQR